MRKLRIGTRGSALALAQTKQVAQLLKKRFPKLRIEIVAIKTAGDEYQGVELFKKSGIGVFTKEIEKNLLQKNVDLAVHSLKDLPTELAPGLELAAVPKRAAIEDALISRERHTLNELPFGAKVGTGSPRRKRQLLRARPDLDVVDLRGNLDTRVGKVLKEKTLDAVVVARAGLERLQKFARHWRSIDTKQILPAVGQGALGLETRKDDPETKKIVRALHHEATAVLTGAERVFLKRLQGGCRVPVGILSEKKGAKIRLTAAVFSIRSSRVIEALVERPWKQADEAGKKLAEMLLKQGAAEFLAEARA